MRNPYENSVIQELVLTDSIEASNKVKNSKLKEYYTEIRDNYLYILNQFDKEIIPFALPRLTGKPGSDKYMQGKAAIDKVNRLTKERNVFVINEEDFKVIETIPGLSHSIKNISDEKLIVLAYANEVFDKLNPDTYHYEIENGKA